MVFAEPHNVSTIPRMFNYADDVSEGSFSLMLLVSIYSIVFLYLSLKVNVGTLGAALAAGFSTVISATLLALFVTDVTEEIIFKSLLTVLVPAFFAFVFKK